MTHRTLDRIFEFDALSLRHYPIRTLALDAPVSKSWDINAWLDQGSEGACVGFGFGHELNAEPDAVVCDNTCARTIYMRAKTVDEWTGENYEGTSVLAGAKILTADGYYTEYRWAETEEDMARAVSHVGPVVIGVDWYSGMFDPDVNGYIRPTGSIEGGHCILVKAINVEEGFYTVHNSWGKSWGDNGTAKLDRKDMAMLLKNWGEVCLPVRRAVSPPEPPNVDPAGPVDPVDPGNPIEPTPIVHCGFWCKVKEFFKALFGAY